jgi:hypothetical protein
VGWKIDGTGRGIEGVGDTETAGTRITFYKTFRDEKYVYLLR